MTRAELGATLALANACLNGLSALLLLVGRVFAARRNHVAHGRAMGGAFATSTLFLASYLSRVALTGTHQDTHTGLFHVLYLAVLGSHMLLAMAVVPLAITALFLGLQGRRPAHRTVVRFAFPVWLYVSVTGVLVYVMLYLL